MRKTLPLAAALAALLASVASADDALLNQTRHAMARAAGFFASISTGGGWVGIYSIDLKQRWGEAVYEKARPNEIWVQPPGTPTVGKTLLRAFRVTGDKSYLAAARNTGRALVWGQCQEGGWGHRVDVSHLAPEARVPERRKGHGTFDDNISQGAVSFLMDLDETLDEPWLDDGVALGLKFLLRSQFPNGAWPQWYPLRGGYHDCYTFNDNAINDCIRVLVDAHRRYGRKEYLEGAKRGGDFIIASQVKAPQSGWAQQYSHDLKPAKARSFEPAAVCSATTARNIRTLVDLAVYTRDTKYLKPIPAALDWLDRSKLAAGLWARLYEVGTNKPIYGDRDGKVHYTLQEISEERRTGYEFRALSKGLGYAISVFVAAAPEEGFRFLRRWAEADDIDVKKIVAALDARGRWVDDDRKIRCQTFVANMRVLCDYVQGASAR